VLKISPSAYASFVLWLGAGCLAGCGHGPTRDSGPSPSATPTPFLVKAQVNHIDATLFDDAGKTMAQVKADATAVGHGEGAAKVSDPIGIASNATATLYQKGKPVAVLTADKLHADRDERTLIGVGHVKVRSLTQPDAPPTIQADTMTWGYKENHIEGSGHVLLTRGESMQLPGASFTADTELKSATLNGDSPTPKAH